MLVLFTLLKLMVFTIGAQEAKAPSALQVMKQTISTPARGTTPENAINNSPPTINKKGRIYLDRSGDKIIVLDFSTRNKMNTDVTQNFTSIYDEEAETKDIQARILRDAEKKNGKRTDTYEVEEGDTLASISQKLYGTPSRAEEIRLLNEDILTSAQVSPGMELKYYKVK